MTQNQIPGTPADTLIPGNNNGQVLGLFTAGGNVQMSVPRSNQNLEIDASIATIPERRKRRSGEYRKRHQYPDDRWRTYSEHHPEH